MNKRIGARTIALPSRPSLEGFAAYVGKKEKAGPLGEFFTHYDEDTTLSQDSWECAESELQKRAFQLAKSAAGIENGDISLMFGGDLLNQCIASGYATRGSSIPFAGLYGACSTMAESLALASLCVDGGYARRAAAITSSHFCAAERQFRFPLEYGGQRAPASQWTVSGSGCALVGTHDDARVSVGDICFGAVCDLGVCDINNMGCAMAPAAADTLTSYFKDTGTTSADYGAIVTGDLGAIGSPVFLDLCARAGCDIGNHLDCGKMIYDRETQGVYAGGSGCGCSASVLCAYLLPALQRGELCDILFMATGALMSTTSFQQGESIPGVAHLVHLLPPKPRA
ncbi:MAG: stage V sporulation protein AD [Oscillospiraceae bacterium]|nr:stage V sporulation protein AD [Oscillospiraceae bacterium]